MVGILPTLPVELWKPIASYLSLSDRAALAISSRYLLSCLGPEALKDLNVPSNRDEKHKFLFHSLNKLLGHYLCDRCVIYHTDAVPYHDYKGPDGRDPLILYPGAQFSFEVLQYAMETHRDPPSTNPANPPGINPAFPPGINPAYPPGINPPYPPIINPAYPPSTEPANPVSSLDLEPTNFKIGKVHWSADTTFYVCDGRLLGHVVAETGVNSSLMQNSVKGIPTCRHIKNPQDILDECNRVLALTPRPWENGDLSVDVGGSSPIYRCAWCPTEYAMTIGRCQNLEEEEEYGAKFLLTVEHFIDFGELYSYHSSEWNALTRHVPAGVKARTVYDTGSRVPIIERVYKAMDEDDDTRIANVLPLFDP